jgi:hypothetical protein
MFDITYKVCSVSIPHNGGDKYWNVGMFATSIEDLRPVICGVVFILDETEVNFMSLFQLLYEKTGRFPNSVVSDQQASLIGALNKLA